MRADVLPWRIVRFDWRRNLYRNRFSRFLKAEHQNLTDGVLTAGVERLVKSPIFTNFSLVLWTLSVNS